jgi:hypothetical protein
MALEDQIEELGSNITFSCSIWRMEAANGAIAAYREGGGSPLEFEGHTYNPNPVDSARPSTSTGLESNSSELRGVFDAIVTRENLKEWAGADVYRQVIVSQLDPSLGSVKQQKGKVGTVEPLASSYKINFESQSAAYSQKVGELTSNSDRNRTIEDLIGDASSFTHSATVTDVTDRRVFKVDWDAPDDAYLENGRVVWLTGANADSKMEIKSGIRTDTNTKTLITLHLEMDSEVEVGDTLNVIRGYKGTREDAVAIGGDAILNTNFEPDVQPESTLIQFPE